MSQKEELLLHTKPVKILVQLHNPSSDNYASQLAREIDCTYSHAVRTVKRLEEHGLIEKQQKGRKNHIELTEPGKNIAEVLAELLHQFRKTD